MPIQAVSHRAFAVTTVWVTLTALMAAFPGRCAQAQTPPGAFVVQEWNFEERDTLGWGGENHLTDVSVHDGALHARKTGPDAYIMVTGLDIDTSRVTHVEFRMKTAVPGSTQIYYATSTAPDPATNEIPVISCAADNAYHVYDVPMEGLDGWSGTLNMLRLDPVNAAGTGDIAIDYIALIRVPPRAVITAFAPSTVLVQPGSSVAFTITAANMGGGRLPETTAVLFAEGRDEPLARETLVPGEREKCYEAVLKVDASQEKIQGFQVTLLMDGELCASAQTYVLAVSPNSAGAEGTGVVTTESATFIQGDKTGIELLKGDAGYVAGIVRTRLAQGLPWKIAGVCSPLCHLVLDVDRVQRWLCPAFESASANGDSYTLTHQLDDNQVTLTLTPHAAEAAINVSAELRAGAPLRVMRFGGPVLLAGEGSYANEKTAAVFPGIEYLDAGMRSSDTEIAGAAHGRRPVPHPKQVTVPVMAVEVGGTLTGWLWDALEPWDGNEPLPMAEFASPNFLEGQRNHLMAVFVPNTSGWTQPNERIATKPYELGASQKLVVKGHLFAAAATRVTDAVPMWLRIYGRPQLVHLVKPLEQFLDDLIQGWAETCYDTEADGFVNHWRMGQQPAPSPDIKGRILVHYLESGDERWINRCNIPADTQLHRLLGPLTEQLDGMNVSQQIASQLPDGAWPFISTPEVRRKCLEFTNGKRNNLGEPGTTNSGVIAEKARPVLAYALATGDPDAVQSGLKALEALDRFSVPLGAQTWEVSLEAPDVYASALVIDCYRMGYELTGDQAYLEKARFWGYTGLPFLYAYQVPGTGPGAQCFVPSDPLTEGEDPFEDWHEASEVFQDPARQITPYGTIPVFGTSFYVVSWFGNLVQWCGLRYADALYGLLQHARDDLLQHAADGILYSGCHQTLDKGPMVGLLPDSWHILTNDIWPAYIGPSVVEAPLRKKLNAPSYTEAHAYVARNRGETRHVNSRGVLHALALDDRSLTWTEQYPKDQSCETVIFCPAAPESVTSEGRNIAEAADMSAVDEGWNYISGKNQLFLRVKHPAQMQKVHVRF